MIKLNLTFNGKKIEKGNDLHFQPCCNNVISVSVDSGTVEEKIYETVFTKSLPNGAVEEKRTTLKPGCFQEFPLGPMTMPAEYIFEAGDVFFIGYQIELKVAESDTQRSVFHGRWCQGLAEEEQAKSWRIFPRKIASPVAAGPGRLEAGGPRKVAYNPKRGIESPLHMKLKGEVIHDQNNLTVLYRLMPCVAPKQLPCKLTITDTEGHVKCIKHVTAGCEDKWRELGIRVKDWPDGDFNIDLYPEIKGTFWEEGPSLTYKRRTTGENEVQLSPMAPWTLERDTGREGLVITNWEDFTQSMGISLPSGWHFAPEEDGNALVAVKGNPQDPFELPVAEGGIYAIFVTPYADGCYLQAGDDPLVRPVSGHQIRDENNGAILQQYLELSGQEATEVFVTAADFSENPLRVFGLGDESSGSAGLACLRLVPVTSNSLENFQETTSTPPVPLYGVNDWGCFFSSKKMLRHSKDQLEMIIAGQSELGLKTADWSVGRSGVTYESQLPKVKRVLRGPSGVDPLAEVLEHSEKWESEIWAWFAMMEYGAQKPERVTALFLEHPEYKRWLKNAEAPDAGETGGGQLLSFYFQEVRQSKTDVLLETAERGVEGLLVGTGRLSPVIHYHPAMVKEYREKFGVDPLHIDAAQPGLYQHWISWRADFFTQLLRELQHGLGKIEIDQSRKIPVAVRIPSTGLFFNLAQGLDVAKWLEEGLIDQLQLAPIECRGGRESNRHDVRPYIQLARRYGVPVIGGLGSTWARAPEALPAGLKRALALLNAGVDGIEIYESEMLANSSLHRWLVPLLGNEKALRQFISHSNIEACFPISARTCLYGYDNHSRWWTEDKGHHWVWKLHRDDSQCL